MARFNIWATSLICKLWVQHCEWRRIIKRQTEGSQREAHVAEPELICHWAPRMLCLSLSVRRALCVAMCALCQALKSEKRFLPLCPYELSHTDLPLGWKWVGCWCVSALSGFVTDDTYLCILLCGVCACTVGSPEERKKDCRLCSKWLSVTPTCQNEALMY